MFEVEAQAAHWMSARSLTGSATAREGCFRSPYARPDVMRFEKRYREKRNLFETCDSLRIDADMTDIIPIQRVVLYLKMKEL